MKRLNKKGFTMAELLIVVAIIAVLVAIAIPVFTTQLEKAKEGTDLANIRSAYAECQTAVLGATSSVTGYSKEVKLKQSNLSGWTIDATDVAGKDLSSATLSSTMYVNVAADGTWDLGASATAGYTSLD